MPACLDGCVPVRSWRGATAAGSMSRCSPRYVQDLQGSLDAPQRPNSLARPLCRVRAAYETAGVLGRSWPRRERVGVSLVSWASSWRGLKLTAHRPSGIVQHLVVGGGGGLFGGLFSRARAGEWTVVGNGQGRFPRVRVEGWTGWTGLDGVDGWKMGWGRHKRDAEQRSSRPTSQASSHSAGQLQAGHQQQQPKRRPACHGPWRAILAFAGPRASNPWARSG
jgi:hypothetical protein